MDGAAGLPVAGQHGLSPQRLHWWNRRMHMPALLHEPERALVLVVEVHEPEQVPNAWLATLVRDLGEELE